MSRGSHRESRRSAPHIQRQQAFLADLHYALATETNPLTRASLILSIQEHNRFLHLALIPEPIHSIHQAKQTLHDHHQSWADTRRDSLAHHQELLNDPWILNASAGQHMDLMHPADFGHHAIAMIPESPFEIGVTVGSLGFGTAGPIARETARFFRMTEQGVRTVVREGTHLLRSAEHIGRRALTSARHTAIKARDAAHVYFEYDLPNALERAFAPGGYSKAERELLQYGDILDAGAQEFLIPSQRDFLVHPTRTTHTARTSHTAPAPSYTLPSDAGLSGEPLFLFPNLPVSTRPTLVPLWDMHKSASGASNYVASVLQETIPVHGTIPMSPSQQLSLFTTRPSYVMQDLVHIPHSDIQRLSYQGGRYSTGVAHASSPLTDPHILLRGAQRNAGFVPLEVARMMEGKTFKNFDRFREEFWRSMANSKYAQEFNGRDLNRMINGNAPIVYVEQSLGNRVTYELHHITPIYQGGATYDISNIMIVTPKYHKEIIEKIFHFGGRS